MDRYQLIILVFGVNRNPQATIPAFDAFKEALQSIFEVSGVSVVAGLIAPKDNIIAFSKNGEADYELSDPTGSAWQSYLKHERFVYHNNIDAGGVSTSAGVSNLVACCKRSIDIFNNQHRSIINYLNYLTALKSFSYDVEFMLPSDSLVLLLRPDLIYKIDPRVNGEKSSFTGQLGPKTIYHLCYKNLGYINDRVLLGSARNMLKIMRRVDTIPIYMTPPWRYFHSEKHLAWLLWRYYHLKTQSLPPNIKGIRVRADGRILDDCCTPDKLSSGLWHRKYFFSKSISQLKQRIQASILFQPKSFSGPHQ